MAAAKPTTVERQVRRVRRRLFAQTFVDTLFWSWGGGLAVLGLWFVLQPLAWHEASAAVHWTVAGVVLGLATLMAFVWAVRVVPSRVDAALALDERFALRERVTTWLLLEPKTASPVADALQADVEHHVGAIHVADRFPVRVRSRTLVAPAIGAALAVALFFLGPVVSDLLPAGDGRSVVQAREVQETLESLKKAVHKPRDDRAAGKEQKELDDALAKLLNRPLPESQQQIRERIQEMRRLEEKIQERLSSLQEQAPRGDRLKAQLEKLAHGQNKSAATDADAKDLEDALAKGAFDKAVDALDKLSKKLQDKGLSPKELEQLARQVQSLQDRLQRLMNLRDLENQLQRDVDLGNLTPEQMKEMLQRELNDLQDLQELAELLKEFKDALRKPGAIGALDALKGKLAQLKMTEKDLDDLEGDAEALAAARAAMLLALQRMNQPGPGLGNQHETGPGSGKRLFAKEPNSKKRDERQRTAVDPRGEIDPTSTPTPSPFSSTFAKVPAGEVGGVVRRSAQAAYQALDRQRIPPDAADMTRRYFEKLAAPP